MPRVEKGENEMENMKTQIHFTNEGKYFFPYSLGAALSH